ncbi:MAG: hypothetical protein E6R08_08815 [Nevskiaceae bacterium]|nr:MAG: hypothetical protein E6R08_08815 [Nevskiaceae bacterium]
MKLRYLTEEVWPTNWKCMIGNFMEGYHLSPLHRMTRHVVNPTRLCSHHPAGDACFGYNAGYAPILPRAQKGHPDLTEAEIGNCVMSAIPPGPVSGCGGDYGDALSGAGDGFTAYSRTVGPWDRPAILDLRRATTGQSE